MKPVPDQELSECPRKRLEGARRIAIVGIGDELSPVDRLGILAAREIEPLHLPGVRVFLAGTVPESITAPLRRFQPDHVLLLDAADMGARPGTIACIGSGSIVASSLSTHALPLSMMREFIEQDSNAQVTLIGIQPDMTGGLSFKEKDTITGNLSGLLGILRDICKKDLMSTLR